MRRSRFTVGEYIILGLIAIGLIVSLRALFIPIVVFGVVFLLYKYPPSSWGASSRMRPGQRSAKRRSKDATFRVITGNKNSDSDDRPKYH